MTKINVFLENIYGDGQFSFDEKKILQNVKKIIKFFLEDSKLMPQSCLLPYSYKTLTFDIVLCNNEKIHAINREYRHKDAATDVITFALFADSAENERFIFDGEINLGEIFVSLDKASDQAKEKGHSFLYELYFLLSHGILHLLGFTHEDDLKLNFMLSC